MTSAIHNVNGHVRTITGPHAIEAYRLKVIKVSLRLWANTGIQPTRNVRILKVAQQVTGLKTRNVDALVAALDALMDAELSQCEIGTLTTPDVQ
jgi:hypothetical protein